METVGSQNTPEQKLNAVNIASADDAVILARKAVNNQISLEEGDLGLNKPSNVKKSFPLLGNHLFKINGPFIDRGRIKELMEKQPELYELIKNERKRILQILGVGSLHEIQNQADNKELAEKLFENITKAMLPYITKESLDEYIGEIINRDIFEKLDEDSQNIIRENAEKRRLKDSMDKLQDYAKEADFLGQYVIDNYFPYPGNNSDLGIVNKVGNEHNLGKLVLIVCDESYSDKARYEALRKLVLTEAHVRLAVYERERAAGNMGLSYFHEAMEKSGIYALSPKKKKEDPKTKYMVSYHDPDTNSCLRTEIYEDEEDAKQKASEAREDAYVTPLPLRTFAVEDEEGGEIEIEGMIDDRLKKRISMALKLLRKDSMDPHEVLKDLNGVRLSFTDKGDRNKFLNTLEKRLKMAGYDLEVEILGDSIGSGRLKCKKLKLHLNGRQYEMQVFTHEEYANYTYQYSWRGYEKDRFYDSSCSEAFVPSGIFTKLNREESRMRAKKRDEFLSNEKWGDMQDEDNQIISI